MNSWFYARNGEQKGPVSVQELFRLAEVGEFNPKQDLVWREGMSDWKKVSDIPELTHPSAGQKPVATQASPTRPTTSDNPYQAPAASSFTAPTPDSDELPEIEPGSSPLGVTECISRGFDLLKRHFGIIFAVWVIYFAISMGVGTVLGIMEELVNPSQTPSFNPTPSSTTTEPSLEDVLSQFETEFSPISIFTNLISQVLSIYLTMGITRFSLNLMAGKPAEITDIFGEGSKLIRGFLASLLMGLIVMVGFLLLIVPGIYLSLRFSYVQTAIVDKNMKIWEAFKYSSTITTNNKWALLWLGVLLFFINVGGFLACCLGLLFTIPLTSLAWLVAYRWLKHGPAALEDRGLLRSQF